MDHKNILKLISIVLAMASISACALNKERAVEISSLSPSGIVNLEVPEPWSSEMTALELCIELPNSLIGNATSDNNWKSQYKDNSGNIYRVNAFWDRCRR